MPKDKTIKCPCYVTRSRRGKKRAVITCELIENNLGFNVRNQLFFENHKEENDYCEIFCADVYEACPYYRAIYAYKYNKDGEKT